MTVSPFSPFFYTPEKIKSIADNAAGDFPYGDFDNSPGDESVAVEIAKHFSSITGVHLVGNGFHKFKVPMTEVSVYFTFAVEDQEAINRLVDIRNRLTAFLSDIGLGGFNLVELSFIQFTNGNGYYNGVCIQIGPMYKEDVGFSRMLKAILDNIPNLIPKKHRDHAITL